MDWGLFTGFMLQVVVVTLFFGAIYLVILWGALFVKQEVKNGITLQ